MMETTAAPLRILMVCELWQGANSYAFARAFRRQGHSVAIVSEQMFVGSGWKNPLLKAARRALTPLIQRDYTAELIRQAQDLKPHLFFVCKGNMVTAEAIDAIKATGAKAILFWPDVSFRAHGSIIPRALPRYDWIFTTKTFGIDDMREQLGITASSFMPHGFDPETHMKTACDASDHARYDCDVSFIGTWSPKKQALLEELMARRPETKLRIWGAQWEKAGEKLRPWIEYSEAFGAEYAKAIRLSKINLAILSEVRPGASMGDQITSRTFHIPASGGFMLHERTDEVHEYFIEDKECGMYDGADEMIAKIDLYLEHDDERRTILEAGFERCHKSAYSIDDRVREVVAKNLWLRANS